MGFHDAATTEAMDLDLDWMQTVADAMIEFMESDPCPKDHEIQIIGFYLDWCVDNRVIGEA